MRTEKVSFLNQQGEELTARLELPVNRHPHTIALFAHCFTCNPDQTAIEQISRALTINGIAVLRFDFTGLEEKENSNTAPGLSSNVEDLLAAASFLESSYKAPALLIGHSLGGAAAICAASRIESIRAVATIAAPFDPKSISRHIERISTENGKAGKATLSIGDQAFNIRQQFLIDIEADRLEKQISRFGKALLILHSPQDMVVPIENAARIYQAARHPKSFLSLDGADHLLSDARDSHYVGELIATWAQRYIDIPEKESLLSEKEVTVRLGSQGYTTDIMVRHHGITADEPVSFGGNDFGPSPYELVAAGLGACTAMTLQMYARRKNWDLREVRVFLNHYKDYAKDMGNTEDKHSKIDHFDRRLELEGDLTTDQRNRLQEIANKCPVHRTLNNPVNIDTSLTTNPEK